MPTLPPLLQSPAYLNSQPYEPVPPLPPMRPPKEQIPPEVLKALVERGIIDEQTAMSLAEERRGWEQADTPGPQGTQTHGPFGMYVAASPLEHAAAGLKRYQGLKAASQGQSQIEALQRRKKLYDENVLNWANE